MTIRQSGPVEVRPNTLRDQTVPNTFRSQGPPTALGRQGKGDRWGKAAPTRRVVRLQLPLWVYVVVVVLVFLVFSLLLTPSP
jgi:hypothetical protein